MTRSFLLILLFLPLTVVAQKFGLPWLLRPTLTGIDKCSNVAGSGRYIVAEKNGQSGLLTITGKPVLPFEYDRITVDYAGVVMASKGGQRDWFDARGKSFGENIQTVISLKNGGYVLQKNKKWGVFNHKLKEVNPFVYEMVETMPDFVLAREEERINLGRAFTPDGNNAGELKEIDLSKDWPGVLLYRDPKTFKKGIMGTDGKAISPAVYNFGSMHQAGYAVASTDTKKWGIIDRKNQVVAAFQYDEIGVINDQLTAPFKKGSQVGILDVRTGQVLVEPGTYDAILTTEKEYQYFVIVKNGLQGICDARGQVLVQPVYDKASKMGPYFFVARQLKSLFPQRGLLGLDGKELLKPDSVKLWVFDNGTLFIERPDGSARHIEIGGRVLQSFEPETAKPFEKNWIVEEKNDTLHFYHASSTPEKTLVFDEVSAAEEGLHRIRSGALFGYMDNTGKLLVPPVFTSASEPDDDYLYVQYQGKWGILKNTYIE